MRQPCGINWSPRTSFDRFPAWVQPLITFISGKPSDGEHPVCQITPGLAITVDLGKLAMGIGLCVLTLHAGGLWILAAPLCWVITVNGLRSLTSDAHYAGHACVTGRRTVDHLLGELLSLLVLSTNMTDYAPGHNQRHHGSGGIETFNDPDLELLYLMGFKAGRRIRWYWMRLWLALVSPRYHVLYARARWRSNFINAPLPRVLLSWLLHGTILALVLYFGIETEWFVAWFIPAIPLVAVSAALQFPSEHLWLMPREPSMSRGDYRRRISHGRFFLVAAPPPGLPAFKRCVAWLVWSIAMIQPLFERFFVCVSVLPAHDFHHLRPRLANWPMEPYLRQQSIESGESDYSEFYGLGPAMTAAFKIWSNLPPDAIQVRFSFLGLIESRGAPSQECACRHMCSRRPSAQASRVFPHF